MPNSIISGLNIAANSKTANLLAGDVNEFVPYDAQVVVSAVTNAAGGTRVSIFADSDLLVDDKEIPYSTATNPVLNGNDMIIDQFAVEAGTRLAVFLRETAGVATTDYIVRVEVYPL
jgi:hypothetical protein